MAVADIFTLIRHCRCHDDDVITPLPCFSFAAMPLLPCHYALIRLITLMLFIIFAWFSPAADSSAPLFRLATRPFTVPHDFPDGT